MFGAWLESVSCFELDGDAWSVHDEQKHSRCFRSILEECVFSEFAL